MFPLHNGFGFRHRLKTNGLNAWTEYVFTMLNYTIFLTHLYFIYLKVQLNKLNRTFSNKFVVNGVLSIVSGFHN